MMRFDNQLMNLGQSMQCCQWFFSAMESTDFIQFGFISEKDRRVDITLGVAIPSTIEEIRGLAFRECEKLQDTYPVEEDDRGRNSLDFTYRKAKS